MISIKIAMGFVSFLLIALGTKGETWDKSKKAPSKLGWGVIFCGVLLFVLGFFDQRESDSEKRALEKRNSELSEKLDHLSNQVAINQFMVKDRLTKGGFQSVYLDMKQESGDLREMRIVFRIADSFEIWFENDTVSLNTKSSVGKCQIYGTQSLIPFESQHFDAIRSADDSGWESASFLAEYESRSRIYFEGIIADQAAFLKNDKLEDLLYDNDFTKVTGVTVEVTLDDLDLSSITTHDALQFSTLDRYANDAQLEIIIENVPDFDDLPRIAGSFSGGFEFEVNPEDFEVEEFSCGKYAYFSKN